MNRQLLKILEDWFKSSKNPKLGTLRAQIAQGVSGISGSGVRLAFGVDGEPELRVELDFQQIVKDEKTRKSMRVGEPDVRVFRWRPVGNMLGITDNGKSLGRTIRQNERALVKARELNLVKASTFDTASAISALKYERARLTDMSDVGASIDAEAALIDARLDEVRAEHDKMHVANKIETITTDLRIIEDSISKMDPAEAEHLEVQRDAMTQLKSRLEGQR